MVCADRQMFISIILYTFLHYEDNKINISSHLCLNKCTIMSDAWNLKLYTRRHNIFNSRSDNRHHVFGGSFENTPK